MWIKSVGNSYVNIDTGASLTPVAVNASWRIRIDLLDTTGFVTLSGIYATEAEALETARQLVHGFDPAQA